ncbi:apolipoprotein N-acyltransferase [Georgenia faecalis]|uniref:Apolipoprotein N-acyltransferase n=1 Tax=Georgenia faecalis TaxID=2483799 RepID=A0ABV9D8P5_9MICO|nr:apolipoprotein N-acyltransferase [Georgenia faecalis]
MPPTPEPRDGAPPGVVGLLLALAGGLVTEAAFPSRSVWALAPLGVALLLLALRGAGSARALLFGTAWGAAFFFPHLWWAEEAAGAVPWVALAGAESLFVGGFALAWVWARRAPLVRTRRWAAVVAVAALWVAVEQLRSAVPFGGFPWGILAFSQTEGPLLRLAALGGSPLVSGTVVVLGALVAIALVHLRDLRVGRGAGALVVAALLVGVSALVPLPTRAEAGTLRVGAVQGNVPGPGLDAFAVRRDVLERHVEGTLALLDEVAPGELDLVVWPENAADIDPRVDVEAARLVEEAAQAVDAPILVGTIRYENDLRYNDVVLWEPGVGAVEVYTKQHPAPFGEYIPMREFASNFTDAVDLVTTDMAAGEETGAIPLTSERLDRVVQLAVAICFEVAYDSLVRDAVLAGGEVLVVPTNNASFGYTQESTQQLAMSVLRAVEHGRATLQISTVGVSGMIAPNGVITDTGGLFTAEQFVVDVPLRTSLTLADRLGPGPAIVAGVVAVLTVLGGVASTVSARRARQGRSSR